MGTEPAAHHYQALVDIGSNGIRFSISDMSPPYQRTMPTVYQDRSGISLYDAQYQAGAKQPIPIHIIEIIIAALLRFKRTCQDFGVQDSSVRVVATEATRNAVNRVDLLTQLEQRTGWKVQLLAKEEEGRLGAMGMASSTSHVEGFCMDMGGGSVQLTWVTTRQNGEIDMGSSVSFPYGAAALMSQLSSLGSREQFDLQEHMSMKLQDAIEHLIPKGLEEGSHPNDGFNLYLSGGGFRGWGHFLMSHGVIQPYPIPIINGYTVTGPVLFSNLSAPATETVSHRISPRRASQIPAVQLLLKALAQTQIRVSHATFIQGGVREGLLYDRLPPSIRAQNALIAATLPYAPPSAPDLINLLCDTTPKSYELLSSTVNMLYVHGPVAKDIRAAAALRSTTTGTLSSAHGLTHKERALLALALCERWGAHVPRADNEFLFNISKVCGPQMTWWARYIGRMAKGIANIYPAGVVRGDDKKIALETIYPVLGNLGWNSPSADTSPRKVRIWITMAVLSDDVEVEGIVRDWAADITKLGKKKNWVSIAGEDSWGLPVDVEVIKKDGL